MTAWTALLAALSRLRQRERTFSGLFLRRRFIIDVDDIHIVSFSLFWTYSDGLC